MDVCYLDVTKFVSCIAKVSKRIALVVVLIGNLIHNLMTVKIIT